MKAFIKTYGCQMNKYTSLVYREELSQLGYEMTENENEADVILLNTCSVRKHAEDRALGRLNSLLSLKRKNPALKIGIVGCMAERLGNKLFEISPHLDFIISPNNIGMIKEAIRGKSYKALSDEPSFPCQKGIKAFVPVSFGCSNYCSYCVVPYTTGCLKSRKKDEVIRECEFLLKNGIKEITLLGQDITSYGRDLNDGNLASILTSVSKMGILRIRFITSHPLGMNEEMIGAIANNKNICPSIHIPLQSGSNRILSLMNRGYEIEYYITLVEKIRKSLEEPSITTDIIVGFPTESKDDFSKTQEALKAIEFDSAFLFKYSPREGTGAYKLKEDLSEKEKIERLNHLIKIQNEISFKKNKCLIGKEYNVLVEGKNLKDKKFLIGRTDTDKMVVFKGEPSLIGKIIRVKIEDASTYTLKGEGYGLPT
ncbi:MAG: tRNA (N6-isopentenyl adenosine(37)-C2)-methylthiotransferase MiaB [bacterium]